MRMRTPRIRSISSWTCSEKVPVPRVCFHFFLLVKWYAMRSPPCTLWPCTAATLVLHAHWFYRWCLSYARKRGKEARAA